MRPEIRVDSLPIAFRIALLVTVALLVACRSGTDWSHQKPVDIKSGDTCAVCGMYITHYPGPRGEAYVQGRNTPLKFGSTRDFFAYVTQPDVQRELQSLFVQDTARIDWNHPPDAADTFIDARQAYYVAWQPLAGAMGPDLASFAKRRDAQAFIGEHGGLMLRFNEVTPQLISALAYRCPSHDVLSKLGLSTAKCTVKKPSGPPQVPSSSNGR